MEPMNNARKPGKQPRSACNTCSKQQPACSSAGRPPPDPGPLKTLRAYPPAFASAAQQVPQPPPAAPKEQKPLCCERGQGTAIVTKSQLTQTESSSSNSLDATTQVRPKSCSTAPCSDQHAADFVRKIDAHFNMLSDLMLAVKKAHIDSGAKHEEILDYLRFATGKNFDSTSYRDTFQSQLEPSQLDCYSAMQQQPKKVSISPLLIQATSSKIKVRNEESSPDAREALSRVSSLKVVKLNANDIRERAQSSFEECQATIAILMSEIADLRRARDLYRSTRFKAENIVNQVLLGAAQAVDDQNRVTSYFDQ